MPIQDSMRAAIYTRVSQDAQRRMRSIEEQEAECRAWAERESWCVVRVWSDNDRSASRFARKERPSWQGLMVELADELSTSSWYGSRRVQPAISRVGSPRCDL